MHPSSKTITVGASAAAEQASAAVQAQGASGTGWSRGYASPLLCIWVAAGLALALLRLNCPQRARSYYP